MSISEIVIDTRVISRTTSRTLSMQHEAIVTSPVLVNINTWIFRSSLSNKTIIWEFSSAIVAVAVEGRNKVQQ